MTARSGSALRTLKLRGAGGEPVDLQRTLLSHGVADLPPNRLARDGTAMETVLLAGGRPWIVVVAAASADQASVEVPASGGRAAPDAVRGELRSQIAHMLRLDEDLSKFYAQAALDPVLSWVTCGAGRMLRSATVFEDVVKTICTTNCAWSGTVRMVAALVAELGLPVPGRPERRAFPLPAAMADADESFYRSVVRAGYRGPYLRTLATEVAEGRLDLEGLADPGLGDEEVSAQLLALAGVGPYAMAHIMMLLGRYQRLILDSWTRPTYRRLAGRPKLTDRGIERAFRRYREFAGLAFWLTLTEDWLRTEDP